MKIQNQKVKVGWVQMSCTSNPADNLKKAIQGIQKAAAQGAKIICLQELFCSLYFCQTEETKHFSLAESIPGPTTQTLSTLAQSLKIVLIASLFEKREEGVYHNTTVVLDADGKLLGKYRKMHIPDDPHYYEKFYFTPGDLGFKTFQTQYAKVGVLICWDQWFPEAARLTTMQGAQILFYPTAIGWHKNEKEETCQKQWQAWQLIQRAHAVANGIYVIAVNRVGQEGDLNFWGHSFAAGPFGEILHESNETEESVVAVDCDLKAIAETRQNWPFLRDRRIDAYQGLTKRLLDTKE